MYQNDPMKVLTGECRLSYAHLIQPYVSPNAKPGTEPKYSVTLLIPKNDSATKTNIDASMEAAIQAGIIKPWGGKRPPMLGTPKYQGHEYPKIGIPIYDGDGLRSTGEPFGDECKGHWVLTTSSKNKPGVVGMDNVNQELAPSDVYSGMWGRVTIRFFAYDNSGNKGVGCGLGNVLKTRDDEPLAGGASAASDFAEIGNSVIPSAQQPSAAYGAGYTAQPNPYTAQPNPFAPAPGYTGYVDPDYPF